MEYIDRLLALDPLYIYGGGFLALLLGAALWRAVRPEPIRRPRGPGYAEAEAAWQALADGLGLALAAASPKLEAGGQRPAQVGGWRVAGIWHGRSLRIWSTWALYPRFSAMAQREQQDLERSGGVELRCAGPDGPLPQLPGWPVPLRSHDGWLSWRDGAAPPEGIHPIWGTGPGRNALDPQQVIRFVEALGRLADHREGARSPQKGPPA